MRGHKRTALKSVELPGNQSAIGNRQSEMSSASHLHRHTETRATMTPATIFESEVTTKRAFAVVTANTTHSAREGKVFRSGGRRHLARLRKPACNVVTIRTGQSFAWAMFSMTE